MMGASNPPTSNRPPSTFTASPDPSQAGVRRESRIQNSESRIQKPEFRRQKPGPNPRRPGASRPTSEASNRSSHEGAELADNGFDPERAFPECG